MVRKMLLILTVIYIFAHHQFGACLCAGDGVMTMLMWQCGSEIVQPRFCEFCDNK